MSSDFPALEQDLPTEARPVNGRRALGHDRESGNPSNAAGTAARTGPGQGSHGENLHGDSRIHTMVPDPARGETRTSFSAETWMPGPEAFIFHCQNPRRGDRWTFSVSRSTLEELEPKDPFQPAAAFDAVRSRVHSAASARMKVADPTVQQVLSAYDIRYARSGARRDESERAR